MRKVGAGLLVLSNLVGNVACAVAAYYAMASYYGWNEPVVAAAKTLPHAATLANTPLAVVLAFIGFALLIPTW